jgi:radical SAM superfamily enzyme YgiQ (UPF0313 family)
MKFHLIAPAWPKLEGQTSFNLPSLGPIQAAACVPGDVDVRVTNENVQTIDFRGDDADLIGLSVLLTCQAPRAYEIAAKYRAQGKTVVMGGLHAALCPEEAAEHVDSVVIGEGEDLIPRMIDDFRRGELQPLYRQDAFPDIARLPQPRRDLYDKKTHYSHKGFEMVDLVQTSRGCRFNCYPCCVPYLGGRQHRIRPWPHVAEDIASTHKTIFIVDNSIEQNKEYEEQLFRNLATMGRRWISHPITPDPKLLKLAADSGCWYVYHAIFNISDKIKDRIKMYHDHGIGVEGTILLGLDHHDEDFILRLIDFLLTIDLDLAEFTVLTPFPRTQVWDQLEAEGRIFDRDWRHYNAGRVVYKPALMEPDRLQELYHTAWDAFYGQESQSWRMGKLFMKVIDDVAPDRRARRRRAAGTAAGHM